MRHSGELTLLMTSFRESVSAVQTCYCVAKVYFDERPKETRNMDTTWF